MDGYQRRLDATRLDPLDPRDAMDEAGHFLRRLIPFPGAETLSPLSLLPSPSQPVSPQTTAVATAIPDMVGEQAASIVSQAAAVLDEEMARGVLAARRSYGPVPQGQSSATNPLLRQAHDLVENIAAIWPGIQGTLNQTQVAPPPSAAEIDALAELKPQTTVRPGQRATVSMTLCNKESRAVLLQPTCTDLVGSRGGRIASALLEITPAELRLEPREQRDLTVAVVVPAETAPGCYSGLLVVKGVDYLRALITIEVG